MRKLILLAFCLFLLGCLAQATTVSVTTSAGMFSSVLGVTTNTFDAAPLAEPFSPYIENGITYTGDFGFYQGSSDGFHRAPTGDATTYISVPKDNAGTSAAYTISGFGPGTNYFGLYWGSLDTYNSITFNTTGGSVTLDGSTISALTGLKIDCVAVCGDPGATSFLNFYTSDPISSIVMSSSNRALETDNHAFGAVPEPASISLMISGIAGLAGVARRKLKR